jgi:hypothetical protein
LAAPEFADVGLPYAADEVLVPLFSTTPGIADPSLFVSICTELLLLVGVVDGGGAIVTSC